MLFIATSLVFSSITDKACVTYSPKAAEGLGFASFFAAKFSSAEKDDARDFRMESSSSSFFCFAVLDFLTAASGLLVETGVSAAGASLSSKSPSQSLSPVLSCGSDKLSVED